MRPTPFKQSNSAIGKRHCRLILALVFALAAPQVHPQSFTAKTAAVFGFVTDTSGAAIPKAAIGLQAPDGKTIQATADENGRFTIEAPAGDYTFKVGFLGFAPHQEAIQLAAISIEKDIVLQVGSCTACVTVVEVPPIELLDASLTSTLPLNPLPPLKFHERIAR